MADRGFITPPPGLIPEPPSPSRPVTTRPAVPAFFPAPPGAPPPAPAPEADAREREPSTPVTAPDPGDPTPAPPAAWVVTAPEGEARLLQKVLVVGRDPRGEGGADVLALTGDGTVSKTHAVLRLEDGRVTVEDLHSTNGTAVADHPGGTPRLVVPGRPAPVPDGGEIRLGDARLGVRRG